MRECPSCALEIDDDREACPYCGYEFPSPRKGMTAAAWLMALLLLIPIIWLVIHLIRSL